MDTTNVHTHRPGVFKQTNKPHKHGRHRSKGSISITAKGKIALKGITKKNKKNLGRLERRNQTLQIRQNKRNEILNKKRCLGGLSTAPFLISLVALNDNVDLNGVMEYLFKCDPEAVINKSPTGVIHIFIPRFKQRFSFVVMPRTDEFTILDALKVSNTVVFVTTPGTDECEIIDKLGQNILISAFSQGLPTSVVAVTGMDTIPIKKRHDCKQEIQKTISKWIPEEKINSLDNFVDGMNILRKIGNQKQKNVPYRDHRPHIFAEDVEFVPDQTGSYGTLKVTGYVRGSSLSVNGLVHIPGMGDYQLSQIDAPFDPYTVDKNENKEPTNVMAVDKKIIRVLDKADVLKQQSLDAENIPDPMDAEQTWPTKEELAMAEEQNKLKKVKKVPKGWSDYQSAWIPDDDADFQQDSDTSHDTDDMDVMSAEEEENSCGSQPEEEFDNVTESGVAFNDATYDQQMDLMDERQALEKIKLAAAKTDKIFPDEVDTPLDQPARIRFQKYRGLESFRTSPWDVRENLPADYGRIFQFENFDRMKKRLLKNQEEIEGASPGWYVTVYVRDVSQLTWADFKGSQVILFGLLQHEHKMSVLNVVLKSSPYFREPIKSKEKLVFQCGYRRFTANPVFSQHTNGQKHKFERFFQPEMTAVVATFYGRIQFPPAPVLCYKEGDHGKLILVATGNLLSCNPDRIILKRIVLSGHPFKIYKRSAVIRFLFFNREDILYFKPIKLRTKMGRTGHIKEPLGTHGHIKCVFDGQLKSQDTVLLNLYKRVFPKWTYEDLTVRVANIIEMDTIENVQLIDIQ